MISPAAPEDTTRQSLRHLPLLALVIGWSGVLTSCCCLPTDPIEGPPVAPEDISFEDHIKPLFQGSCLPCHNGATAAGDLDLRSRQLAFRSSPNGPFIVPGSPERSKIFRMVKLAEAEPGAMPPTGHALTERQLEHLKIWITRGADWPADESGTLKAATGMNWRSQ